MKFFSMAKDISRGETIQSAFSADAPMRRKIRATQQARYRLLGAMLPTIQATSLEKDTHFVLLLKPGPPPTPSWVQEGGCLDFRRRIKIMEAIIITVIGLVILKGITS